MTGDPRPSTTHATESVRDRRRHLLAVEAEMHKLERNLRDFGPMPCDRLSALARAERWREGTFEEAVALGVREGRLARLPFDWVKVVNRSRL